MIDCSEKLRQLRLGKHLTQGQLAQRVGVTKGMVSAYETASKAPSLDDSSAALVIALVDKLAQTRQEPPR